jgi:hypothetical protein
MAASVTGEPVFEILRAVVATPPDGSLDDEASRVVEAVRGRYDVELEVISGDQALLASPAVHTIALGCLADNPFVEALYLRWNTLVDRWYPGDGGRVVQMIPSPFRKGDHVLLLGGSDPQGVGAATSRFIELLESNVIGQLPWQLDVQLGNGHLPLPQDRIDELGTAASPVVTPESTLPNKPYESGFEGGSARDHLLRLGMYGPHADNLHLSRSSQLGLRYLYTGRREDAEGYRRALLAEARFGVIAKLYHYKSVRMFQLWSLLGACPVFDESERAEVSRAIRQYLEEESGLASVNAIRAATVDTEILNRHHACDALNLWVGGDWLRRQSEASRWREARQVADSYFEAQAGTDVPLTGLTEGYATYLEITLEWMLLSCPERIADDPHIRLWAERVMGLCTNSGQLVLGPQTDASRYPYHLMRKLAHLLADGRYLFVADLRERQVQRGMDRALQFSAGQAYAGDVEAIEPDDDAQVTVYPANERLRWWKAPSISSDAGFDRAVARSGWRVEDDYLMVVGMRSGGKSLPNVGALAAYERFGQRLITSDAIPLFPHSASMWRHSLVTVNTGGLGGGITEGAEILSQKETAGGHLLSYRLEARGHRWIRQLYWKPSAYLLVVDRVSVAAEETFTLGVNWRCAGPLVKVDGSLATMALETDGRFYVQVSEGLLLQTETNTYPALGAPPGTAPLPEVMLHATSDHHSRDGEVEVATLLHAVDGASEPCYRLGGEPDCWVVEGSDQTRRFTGTVEGMLEVELGDGEGRKSVTHIGGALKGQSHRGTARCSLPTRWAYDLPARVSVWSQAVDGATVALGTEEGHVIVLDAEGNLKWSTVCEGKITALTFLEDDVIAGTHSGQVCRLDPEGCAKWRHQCRFRDERVFWPYWFLETPTIGALDVGCDPESGLDLVAVGTGSTSLNFLEAESGVLLEDVISPYGLPDRIRAHVSTSTGGLQFLVGHAWLTCGSTIRAWRPTPETREARAFCRSVDPIGRATDGWDNCGVVDFGVGPLAPDTSDVVVVLRHGAVNQLTVYEEKTGDPLWDVGLGGAPVALAVVQGDASTASARIYVAEQFGWLAGFTGTGRRVVSTRLAESLQGMHAGSAGSLALWNSEELYITEGDQVASRYCLDGDPLGWRPCPDRAGMLCVEEEQLVMKEVADWVE